MHTSGAPAFVAAGKRMHPLAPVAKLVCVIHSHRTVTNKESQAVNQLFLQSSVKKEWTETPNSQSFSEKGLFDTSSAAAQGGWHVGFD